MTNADNPEAPLPNGGTQEQVRPKRQRAAGGQPSARKGRGGAKAKGLGWAPRIGFAVALTVVFVYQST